MPGLLAGTRCTDTSSGARSPRFVSEIPTGMPARTLTRDGPRGWTLYRPALLRIPSTHPDTRPLAVRPRMSWPPRSATTRHSWSYPKSGRAHDPSPASRRLSLRLPMPGYLVAFTSERPVYAATRLGSLWRRTFPATRCFAWTTD